MGEVGGGGCVPLNSRHAIRERPHVCTIGGIRRERGRGGGRGCCGVLCTAVMRTAVLKQYDCNAAQP